MQYSPLQCFSRKFLFSKIIKTVCVTLCGALIANITFAKQMTATRFMHSRVIF